MADTPLTDQCADDTQKIVINIPCRLARWTEKIALQTVNTLTWVVIEAIDALLIKSVEEP